MSVLGINTKRRDHTVALGLPQRPPSLREIDFSHYVHHYIDLFWRWKLWIFTVLPVSIATILVVLIRYLPMDPELSTSALIAAEGATNMSSILDISQEGGSSRAELMQSRRFLQTIVSKLSLCFALQTYKRKQIFDSIYVDMKAQRGSYMFEIENMKLYRLYVKGPTILSPKVSITSGNIGTLDTLCLPGMYLKFTRSFLINPTNFSFGITSERKAVENLYRNLTIKPPDQLRQRYNIEVSMKGRDYALISEIVNAIADAFVEKSLLMRKGKYKSIITVLERQFVQSKAELEQAENQLQRFRMDNPTVGLNTGTQQTVNSLMDLETSSKSTKENLNISRSLQAKYNSASIEDQVQIAGEIVVFLRNQNNNSAPVFETELSRLSNDKRDLSRTYAEGHPLILENQRSLERLLSKIDSELVLYIKSIESTITQKESNIYSLTGELRKLPKKELELAELQRQLQVNSDIYANILNKYNKAKVADVVEVSDVYILDYAVPPIPPPVDPSKIIAVCIAIVLGITFGPMLFMDFIDKTARTEFELRRMSEYMVLESIPEIVPSKKKRRPH